MSGNMNPSGPAQPTLNQAYTTSGNAATQEPAEKAQANANAQDNSSKVEQRVPTKQTSSSDEATPSSLGIGIHGAPPGEEAKGQKHDTGLSGGTEAEQMRAPGEGEVRDAVDRKPGATGEEPGLETDLDRKKAEQAPLRAKYEEEKQKDVDVAGVLGQRGGPANPVDKNGYPN
ncbi:hypothetical protein AMS68_002415 [Peltaster fructicola]|uniref:Uncharacterized protein n=1 Tax=Peltaster fructicola TaxID=286661 RepID=A0A6H0XQI1_9PEZI|nr:hypothetical protein AMS68_002415 [Peltaster fructicola]